jgi:hypothetical protein
MSRAERLAAFFRRSPGTWYDGRELGMIAGCYGWRSRVSDLRRPPFNMTIENRQRTVGGPTSPFTISEYRYVPTPAATDAVVPTWELTP